jgi:hypothetical protein
VKQLLLFSLFFFGGILVEKIGEYYDKISLMLFGLILMVIACIYIWYGILIEL